MIRRFLILILYQIKIAFQRRMFKYISLIQPIISTFLLYFISKSNNNFDSRLIIFGPVYMSIWSSLCFSAIGDINRERSMGTLIFISSTPTSLITVMFTKFISSIIYGIFSLLLSSFMSIFVLSIPVPMVNILSIGLSFVVLLFSFLSLAIIVASLITRSRQSLLIINILEYPIFIVTGMLFPITILPRAIRLISFLIPSTYAINAMNKSVDGAIFSDIKIDLGCSIILSILILVVSLKIFDKFLLKARETNSLEEF